MKTLKIHYLPKDTVTVNTCSLIIFQLKKTLFFQMTTLQEANNQAPSMSFIWLKIIPKQVCGKTEARGLR